jgi:hypothetical protein
MHTYLCIYIHTYIRTYILTYIHELCCSVFFARIHSETVSGFDERLNVYTCIHQVQADFHYRAKNGFDREKCFKYHEVIHSYLIFVVSNNCYCIIQNGSMKVLNQTTGNCKCRCAT